VCQPADVAVTVDDARQIALSLPRATEGIVRDSIRFRVGRIVFLAFSPDERFMEFAYPKEERDTLVESDPERFMLPRTSDLRYNWVRARAGSIELDDLREIVVEAWRMCVPKKVSAEVPG
jgi:hypothetical protein